MASPTLVSRRKFLKLGGLAAAGSIGFPALIPSSALGKDGTPAPSNRIAMGFIGTGGQGRNLLNQFMNQPEVQAVAVADVDRRHRAEAARMVNARYENQDCAAYLDFRELLARRDIDAVLIATPDHWHALAAVAAANAGKDIYCEKPLANSVAEGRAICDAVARNGRILQTGSQERSGDNARFACELVRNGRIGRLESVEINLPCNDGHHQQVIAMTEAPPPMPVPEELDYDFWLGPTAKAPYTERRCHFWWRFILAYGGGEMTDRGAHIIDLAQLGAGTDDTGPIEIEASGTRAQGLYDAFMDYQFENRFANGVRLIGRNRGPRGLRFVGSEGSIFIHIHGGRLEADPASLLEEKIGPDEIQLGRSPGHYRNFLDCVKSREQPLAHAEIGHRTGTLCHLNNIAMLVGRKLRWDPVSETIADDPEANALLAPRIRQPWRWI